jgi:phosphoribosylformylglycinamidine synthase
VKAPKDLGAALLKLLASPNIADKRWVWRQYDHQVRTNTLLKPGSDAAVLRVKENGAGLALSVDGNGRYVYLDPKLGGQLVIAEACRNVAVTGAEPIGLTDCLNFGNPEKPEIMWQFAQAVKGMAEACHALKVPIVSGNVSLYNQGPKGAIHPTPIVGAVGLMEPVGGELRPVPQWFQHEGDAIYLAGSSKDELGGSEYLALLHHKVTGLPPSLSLKAEAALQKLCIEAARRQLVASAHDLSDGGLAVALAESCLTGIRQQAAQLGAEITLKDKLRADALLFGESASRVLFSCAPDQAAALEKLAKANRVPLKRVGTVGGSRLQIQAPAAKASLDLSLDEMHRAFFGALNVMEDVA